MSWHPAPTHARPVTAGQALADIHVTPWDRDFLDTKAGVELWSLRPGESRREHHSHHVLHPDAPAATLLADFLAWYWTWHWSRRPLRVREWAALQGFPESFMWTGVEKICCPMIGNSVPPPLAEAVGRAVADLLRGA